MWASGFRAIHAPRLQKRYGCFWLGLSFQQKGRYPHLSAFLLRHRLPALLSEKVGGMCQGSTAFHDALNTVLQTPAFRAARSDKKKEAVAVKEFLGLGCGLCATDCGICETRRSGHGVLLLARGFIPPEVPPKRWAVYGFFQPSSDYLFRLLPCQERLFRHRRTRLN